MTAILNLSVSKGEIVRASSAVQLGFSASSARIPAAAYSPSGRYVVSLYGISGKVSAILLICSLHILTHL